MVSDSLIFSPCNCLFWYWSSSICRSCLPNLLSICNLSSCFLTLRSLLCAFLFFCNTLFATSLGDWAGGRHDWLQDSSCSIDGEDGGGGGGGGDAGGDDGRGGGDVGDGGDVGEEEASLKNQLSIWVIKVWAPKGNACSRVSTLSKSAFQKASLDHAEKSS